MRWSFKSNSYYSVHAHLTGGEPAGGGMTDMSPAHSGLYSLQSLDGAKVVSSEKDLTAYFDHLDVTTRAGTGTAGGAAGVGARGAKDPGKHLVLLDQEKVSACDLVVYSLLYFTYHCSLIVSLLFPV